MRVHPVSKNGRRLYREIVSNDTISRWIRGGTGHADRNRFSARDRCGTRADFLRGNARTGGAARRGDGPRYALGSVAAQGWRRDGCAGDMVRCDAAWFGAGADAGGGRYRRRTCAAGDGRGDGVTGRRTAMGALHDAAGPGRQWLDRRTIDQS
ncbi:unnamed protein product [Rhizophagus irregularis]|uniref:Uncharacterized protein n=1 Tax=Rhizophagus irregularis TaxID=588596 RepID=A0A915ZD35_9GLOM|nr:unnamed protein product [Rhizophagus irregularis]